MKKTIVTIFLLIAAMTLGTCLFCQSTLPGQGIDLPPADTTGVIEKLKASVGHFVSDFNFQFYPASTYAQHTVKPGRVDTVGNVVRVAVDKTGNRLTLQNLDDMSRPIYFSDVNYIGHNGVALAYLSTTQSKDVLLVSPLFGWAIVVFEHADKQGYTAHCFGKCPSLTDLLK